MGAKSGSLVLWNALRERSLTLWSSILDSRRLKRVLDWPLRRSKRQISATKEKTKD